MMNRLLQAGLAAACAMTGSAAQAACDDPPSLVADRECMSTVLSAAERTMERYLKVAQARVDEGEAWRGKRIDLARSQALWEAYRKGHCEDVYESWAPATHAHRAQAKCEIAVVRQRTHDLWAAYLTSVDGTPPALPEPSFAADAVRPSRR